MNFSSINFITLYGILVGLVPSFLLLVYLMEPYEKEVEDDVLWKGFFFGFFLGVIAFLLEAAGFFGFGSDAGVAFYSIFGLSIVHPMMIGMILNRKENHEKRESIAFGASLGFGFSSSYGFTIFAGALLKEDIVTAYQQLSAIIYVLGIIMLLGSTGVVIGYGVFAGEYGKCVGLTITVHILPNVFKFLKYLYLIPLWLLALFLLLYGGGFYLIVKKDFMPHLSPEAIRRKKIEKKLIIKERLG